MSAWLPLSTEELLCKNFHDEFLLLRRQQKLQPAAGGLATLPTLGQTIYDQHFAFVDEVIATEVEICLRLNPRFREMGFSVAVGMVVASLQHLPTVDTQRDWRVPVYFTALAGEDATPELLTAAGPRGTNRHDSEAARHVVADSDWGLVEQTSGLPREQVVERLLQIELRLAMFGFLPGFAYLSGLPQELHIPRKHTPATVAPANALALGGKYLGIYSLPSPAGWHVIGRLGVHLMQCDTLPPICIRPGDRVRLERIDWEQLQSMQCSNLTLADYNSNS